MQNMNNIWTIIAAYNEEKNISKVIEETKKFCNNIVVVDDGSKDNTFEVAKSKDIHILKHIINLGKGGAIKTGCDFALDKGAEVLILVDGDGQHNPKDIPNFIKALENKDLVFGYRKFSEKMPLVYRLGNTIINKATKILHRISLKDTQCGFRALRTNAYKKTRWRALDYFMESEMIANAGKHKLKYDEVQIDTVYSEKYKGTTVIDGIKIVLNLFLWRFKK